MHKLQVNQLNRISGGLNIEGGYPYAYLMRDNPLKKVRWANIVLVLDRPLIDNVLFEDLDKKMKDNNYPLLENTVDEINEHQMFAMYLMILGYYLEHGKQLLNKNKNDDLIITVHMHQDIASAGLLITLSQMIDDLRKDFNFDVHNIKIDYRTDHYTFISTNHNYQNTDILLSLSQCAGLDPCLKPGDMIVTNEFIPYDISQKTITMENKYEVSNDLMNRIQNILKSPYHEYSINYVNNNYVSKNKGKRHNAYKMTDFDFNPTPILQVNALWNPINETEIVTVIE